MEKKKLDMRVVIYLLLATALILVIRYFDVLLGGAGNLWGITMPLIMGGVIAYVLNIIMRMLEKIYFPKARNVIVCKTRRPVCIVLSMVLIVTVLVLVFRLVIPELGKAFVVIGQGVPVVFEQVVNWLAVNLDSNPEMVEELNNLTIDWNELGNKVFTYLKAGLGGFLNSTVSIVGSVMGGIVNFVVSLIFAIYILSSKEKLGSQFRRIVHAYVKPKWRAVGKRVIETADSTFSSFIVGQVTEAVILGSLCTVCMLIFGFPYAPMIGAFIGVTALIPVVGAYIGAAVGAFMILTQDPLKAVLFLVFIVVLQQVEGNLIYPRVVGSSIGLPGMWVLASVTVGGGLMGVPGMLLGVPTAATVYKLLAYDVNRRNAAAEDNGRHGKHGKKSVGKPAQEEKKPVGNTVQEEKHQAEKPLQESKKQFYKGQREKKQFSKPVTKEKASDSKPAAVQNKEP